MLNAEYRAARTASPITVSDDEATLLQALRTGRWWAREARGAQRAGDTPRALLLAQAADQCKTAALYWLDRCLIARRSWKLPVLGVRLTRAQHRIKRECCRYEIDGHCEWRRLFKESPPVGQPPQRSVVG